MTPLLKTVLVLSLLFVSFLASDSLRYTGNVVDDSASVVSSSCTPLPEGAGYRACADVQWKGEGFIKVYIPGISLSKTPSYTDFAFTHCQDIFREGSIPVSLYTYRSNGVLDRKRLSARVSCGDASPISPDYFETRGQFTAEPTNGQTDGSGVYVIELPRKALSCVLEGTYRTVNTDPTGPERGYCHDAHGTFLSSIDQHETQSVHNDRDYFFWNGLSKPAYDPIAEFTRGYLVSTPLCDSIESPSRNFVRARALLDHTLEISWKYHNDETHPRVDYSFTVRCDLEQAKKATPPAPSSVAPLIEQPTDMSQSLPKPYIDERSTPKKQTGVVSYLYHRLTSHLTKTI